MHAILAIVRKAVTVYAVTIAAFLALWSGIWLVRRPTETGAEYASPLPAELVAQIEERLQRGAQ